MAGKKVLIVVDWQNDFVNGALGFEGADRADKVISELVAEYINDTDGIVICTFDTHFEKSYLQSQEGRKLPVPHCVRCEEGWELFGDTGKLIQSYMEECVSDEYIGKNGYEGEEGNCILDASTSKELYFVEKPTFPSIKLGELISNIDKHNNIESITLVGLVTNMCVMGNAIVAKAACPEAEIIIKKDLVDSFDKELHQKALDVMASMQMTIE